MVRLVTKETLPQLLELCDADDMFATFLYTYGSVYCDVTSKVEIWLGFDNNNQPNFAAVSSGGGYIIYPKDESAYEYIWAFLTFMPSDNIICRGELMRYLERKMFVRPEYSCIMRYGKGYSPSPRQKTIHPKRFKDMYSLLCKVFPKICREEKSDEWVYTTSLKERRGFVTPVCIYDNDSECIGCGMIDATNSKSCVIGAIAVASDNRGDGIGIDIICSLLSKVIEQEKVAYLNCSEELRPFYESIGFKLVGEYAHTNQI